jgi:RNA polymerase sigma-70 factor (ECF subfamily)
MKRWEPALDLPISAAQPTVVASTAEPELDPLMAQLADGDRSAFAPVFGLLWPPIHRLCLRLLENDADAADAAQEAMHKILERASDYDRRRPAMPWAMAIAGWECRTLARKRQRRREVAEEEAGEQAGSSLEEAFVERDLTQAAVASLGELSDTDRETLVATFWDEAASASGATLRKRRERALDRLRSAFRRLYAIG